MKAALATAVAALALVGLYLFFGAPSRAPDFSGLEGDAARGAYVLRVAGCVSCHTKPDGGAFLAGGAPLETPFGTFHAPNITSDDTAGIGAWTRDDFADALLNGKGPHGSLYPVFPFTAYAKMTDQDLLDLWTYMQSVPAVAEPAPRHALDNPLLVRPLMRPWRTLFFKPGTLAPVDGKTESWERGRYIVEGIGHCTECHTPRNSLGVLQTKRDRQGGTLPPRGEKVPAITADALKARGYDHGDLLMAFQYGLTPDGDVLGGSMGEVVSDQLGHLTPEDLAAIATYLLDE